MNKGLVLPFLVFALYGCEGKQETFQADPVPNFSERASLAIADLSNRLGAPPGEVELVSEKSVTWRDSSLGCPKEGMMYTQALVEGALIVLQVNGMNYHYHSSSGRPPFLCENPQKPAAKPSPD